MTSDRIDPTKRVERARELALSYLDRRMRSRHELATYLQRRGVAAPVVDEVLDDMAARGFLDDAAFARAFALDRVRLAPRGYRLIAAELGARRVSREIVASVLREVEAEYPEIDLARELVRSRRRRLEDAEPEVLRRTIGGWLTRRGFRHETIRRVLDESDEV